MKLKTKIVHSFDVDSNSMEDLEFSFILPEKTIKKKTKIVEVKKKNKLKIDVSTRLF